MTKSLAKIIYSIKEQLSAYHVTDDTVYDDEFLADKIADVRSNLIYDEQQKKSLSDGYYQQICCLEVMCEEKTCTINGVDVSSGDVTYYIDLPALNERVGDINIKYLGLTDMLTKFDQKSMDGFISLAGSPYTSGRPAYMRVGKRAYLRNLPTDGTRFLCIIGLLANPVNACDFSDEETPYPVPDVFKLELIVKRDILSTYGISADELQDSRDKAVPPQEAKTVQKQSNQRDG